MFSDMFLQGLVEFCFNRFVLPSPSGVLFKVDNFNVYTEIIKKRWSPEDMEAARDYFSPPGKPAEIGRLLMSQPTVGLWHGGAVFWPHVRSWQETVDDGRRWTSFTIQLLPRWSGSAVVLFCRVPAHVSFADVAAWEKTLLEDPETAGPYGDWCQEAEWPERAAMLHATPPSPASPGHSDQA